MIGTYFLIRKSFTNGVNNILKRDLRKFSKKDFRGLFKIADDLENDEDKKEKELGKNSLEEQKENESNDNEEEIGNDKDEEEETKENNGIDSKNQASKNTELIKSSIEQISNTGREVLKQVEKFKFNLEQTSRMLSQSPQLSQGMMAKRKSVNEISNKLYQIIFDIENTDISLAFQQESPEAVVDNKNDVRNVGEPKPQAPQPGTGPVPPNPNLNKKDDSDKEDNDEEDEDLELDEEENEDEE